MGSIERARHLATLRTHPGYPYLIALSEQIVKLAEDALVSYQGWDKDELVARRISFRSAQRQHELLFSGIARAIDEGTEEATIMLHSQDEYSREASELADELRALVLENEKARSYDTRILGTY